MTTVATGARLQLVAALGGERSTGASPRTSAGTPGTTGMTGTGRPPGASSRHPSAESFARLQCQLMIASQLGIDPLTVAERAQSLLTAACAGWRRNRRCTSPNSPVLARPHDTCVLAQYHHDLLLLDHGLLDHAIEAATPITTTGASSPGPSPKRKRTAG